MLRFGVLLPRFFGIPVCSHYDIPDSKKVGWKIF